MKYNKALRVLFREIFPDNWVKYKMHLVKQSFMLFYIFMARDSYLQQHEYMYTSLVGKKCHGKFSNTRRRNI